MLTLEMRAGMLIGSMLLAFVTAMRIPRPFGFLLTAMMVLCCSAIVVEVIGYLTTLRHLNNTMLFDSFILFESFMVLAMTYSIRPHWKWNLVLAGCLGAMGMVWDFTSQTGEGLLGRGILIIACVMNVVLLALLWSVARESDRALHQVPQFWLFMGILLFYGGLIPVLAMVGFVFQVDQHLAYSLWSIPPVLGAVRYLFATHACVLERRLRQKAPNE